MATPELHYVTKIMKRVLGIEGRSKFMHDRSVQFLKLAGIEEDFTVENGGGQSLLISEKKAEELESFYRSFFKSMLFDQLDAIQEKPQ